MFGLIPRDVVFFDFFERAADNVHEGALAVRELLENFGEAPVLVEKIREIEHRGDSITHETLRRVYGTFITPIDREDIHELVCRLDDVIDFADGAVSRIVLYKVSEPTEDAKALARSLCKSTEVVREAVRKLRTLQKSEEILKLCVQVHTHENEADRIYQHAIAALFESQGSPLDVIKWKDIYQELELATDRCEDVANVIEGIVLKNV
ncbi:MAG: DUF47 domain-containing protein [Planctomycetes bacterium]|nr:DUF47 domain-containing protein [Planctomycetota bacterium]